MNNTTIDMLIRKPEKAKLKYGGDAIVALEGYDEGSIILEDNYDEDLYPNAKILITI
jgi:hypothetical protein